MSGPFLDTVLSFSLIILDTFITFVSFFHMQCLVDGADEYLQLLDVASNTTRALCNMPQEFSYES